MGDKAEKAREYRYRSHRFGFRRPLLMGIVNVTPDSFSDGGRFFSAKKAIAHAEQLIRDGADILDIGGESTRPGAEDVSIDEETRRVIPVIEALVEKHPATPISIDSRKPDVARAAIDSGAAMINDVGGLRDPRMAELAAECGAPVVIMHMKGEPGTMQRRPVYKDVVAELLDFFHDRVAMCEKMGIRKIIIDPGIGFGKTAIHNLLILQNINRFAETGYPTLVGASRKAFIGKTLDKPAQERDNGSLAVTTAAVLGGASIIRVHNVAANLDAAKIAWAIKKGATPKW